MGSKIEKTSKSKKKKYCDFFLNYVYEIIAILILFVGFVFFSLHRDYDSSMSIDGSLWGQYGDYVGGLVGTLLAYMSIKLLNKNLQEQIIANRELRTNNEDNRKVAALQQFDSSFSTLIDMYRNHQSEVKKLEKTWAKEFTSDNKDYKKRVEEAIEAYRKFYEANHSLLSSYYRLLYRIMQTIDEANVDEDIKRRYAKIFRCQISEEELLLLRYNALTHYGKKMQVYINRYNLLKHLSKLHLLEFKESSILRLVNGKEELFDRLFIETRQIIMGRICINGDTQTSVEKCNKIELANFDILCDISKSRVKIELVYVSSDKAKNPLSDDSLQLLLKFYIFETFVYASFGRYQTLASIDVNSDINTEQNSKKHTVWVQVQSKENYPLILSLSQLDNPQK